jgi:ABC-type microcin C transport system permease subunit YejE
MSRTEKTMTNRSLVRFMLIAMLASGCAMHTPPAPGDARPVGTDDKVGAVAANIWYVPSRALLCGVGATISAVVMTVTLGQAYDSASELMHGGCSGPWLVHPEDIRQAVP